MEKLKNVLSLDTSGFVTSIALRTASGAVVQRSGLGSGDTTNELAQLYRSLLDSENLSSKDLDLILLGEGPGSFTGLRVGFAFAKGLAYACKLPVQLFCSLDAMAASANIATGTVLAATVASRNKFFISLVEIDGTSILKPQVVTVEALEDTILSSLEMAKLKKSALTVVTRNSTNHLAAIKEAFSSYPIFLNDGLAIGGLALHEHSAQQTRTEDDSLVGQGVLQLSELSPNYVQAVSAKSLLERGHIQPSGLSKLTT